MPDLSRVCPTWDAEPLADRLERCRRLLAVEGLLTDSESARVVQRIEREWERLERVEGVGDGQQ